MKDLVIAVGQVGHAELNARVVGAGQEAGVLLDRAQTDLDLRHPDRGIGDAGP
jgi:hypothetical protein